ncbi:MAG TPA: protein kinase [Candidatus Polarisedimenticolia bacterium]|nr:protein kinase [Candidatus Polarisedimenticolia bacterium]
MAFLSDLSSGRGEPRSGSHQLRLSYNETFAAAPAASRRSPGAELSFEPGQILTHYRIERLIGEGGMGAVYLAEDTKLHRKVALKVLPAAMASHADRLARFQREAQAVAALNHPHIVTLYSVEEAEGTHFLTMELVEGTSLDRVLSSGGLPLEKVFDVGIALADALAAAHEKGIIHRDLKPANVMVTREGRVKVLDFGLAKLAPGASEQGTPHPQDVLSTAATGVLSPGQPLTTAGLVVGTVPYMSPEQVGGETVDARTDIFSLGVLLYELATGQRPFRGKNQAETISSILRDTPAPVSETRQDAPRELSRIIDHCLQKDPDARFQTAKDVRNELRALGKEVSAVSQTDGMSRQAGGRKALWIGLAVIVLAAVAGLILFRQHAPESPQPSAGTATTASAGAPASVATESPGGTPDPKSIAVLPFMNMSSEKEQDYFSDGISEDLLNLLAKVHELKVVARTSSFSFKGKNVGIPEIGRQLHVAHVLEGSVRRNGNQVRIAAQLIQAADGFQIWSEIYDRRLDDIFKIQDEIAADVVKELKITLLGEAPKARETDPKAYALYLRATALEQDMSAEGFAKSDALYRQALEIDPRYAPAWSGLSINFINKQALGILSGELGYARAREASEKAVTLDPSYAPAHATLGYIADSLNDLPGAARHFEKALALDPNNTRVLLNAANLLRGLGRKDEALALLESIVPRDPLNAPLLNVLGSAQTDAGRFDDAIATCRTLLDLKPGRGRAHYCLAVAMMLKGDAAGALAEIQEETSEAVRMIGLPMAYHALGRRADSDAALAALIAKLEKDAPYNIAYVYAFRGEADKAFEWLDKASAEEDPGLAEIVFESMFNNIHSDPRWLPFLRKIGKAPDQLAKIHFTLPPDLLKQPSGQP